MKKLKSHPISEPWQVELMRHIYNENLATLATKPISRRSYEEQQTWWNENRHQLRAYLYEPIDRPGKFVAFLVLTDRGGFSTPIIALQKEEHNRGYGKELVADYIEKANGPIACSQLQSNSPICQLHKNFGLQILGQREEAGGTIDLLFHPGLNSAQPIDSKTFDSILDYLKLDKNSYYTNRGHSIKT